MSQAPTPDPNVPRVRALNRAKLADALLSSALDCIVVSDVHGRIVEFNPAAEQTFGWSRDEILGLTMEETIVPHAHRAAHRAGMKRYLAHGGPRAIGRRVEIEGLHATGDVFPVELSITETRMDDDRFFVATLRNIAAQKKVAAELKQAQASLEAIFDNIPAALYLRDRQDKLVMINTWGAHFLGRDVADMVGQPMSKFRQPHHTEDVKAADESIVRNRAPESHVFTYHFTGGDRIGLMTYFPVLDEAGEVTQIGGMLLDVTELYTARDELQQARARLQAFFDHIPAGIFINKIGAAGLADQVCEFANDLLARPFGLTGGQLIGSNPYDRFADDAAAPVLKAMDAEILATRRPVYRELINRQNQRHESHTRFPILNAAGEITHIGGVSIDIDDRVRVKEQLYEFRALLESLFDNIPAELYLRELNGAFVMMNRWGANFYGHEPHEMVGQLASAYDTGDEVETARLAQERLITSGQPVTQEYHYLVDGRDVTVLNTIFPVKDAEGRIVRIGGVTTDVTELQTARNQLRMAQETLHQSEKLAALGQLLAGVAHELNNPLAVVLGRAAILQEKLEGTQHAAALQKLREAANRCARIVKTFLAMARQTGPRREWVEVNALIESALEMTTYSLRTAGVVWNVAPLSRALRIEVDEDQIVQVLINLILNAQQALDDRPADRRIDITAGLAPDGNWLSLTVADNGPGVAQGIANRIFDPFFTTKEVGQGTGLGLSVCKSMVEAHGGKLLLEPTPGGGASFRIALPIQELQRAPDAAQADVPSPTAHRGRILIVDDEVEIAAILADCLTPLGIECVLATDGMSALQRLSETGFDGIFCDVSMPGMDGISFFNRLKETNPILARHLIFISGDVLHRDWKGLATVADRPIIEKPFDPQLVRAAALSLLAPEGDAP